MKAAGQNRAKKDSRKRERERERENSRCLCASLECFHRSFASIKLDEYRPPLTRLLLLKL